MAASTQQVQQLEKYGEDGLDYLNQSQLLKKCIIRKYSGGKGSAMTIRSRLNHFGLFILREKTEGNTSKHRVLQSGWFRGQGHGVLRSQLGYARPKASRCKGTDFLVAEFHSARDQQQPWLV